MAGFETVLLLPRIVVVYKKKPIFSKNTVSHSELKRNGLNWLNKEPISLRVGDTKIF